MLYAGMTFLSSGFWTLICFSIYLLLECDGSIMIRWFLGLFVIAMYSPAIRFIRMNREEWKSFLLVLAGVVAAACACWLMCYYTTR